jgi:uncharacterized protein YdaU (DUF1376 family)
MAVAKSEPSYLALMPLDIDRWRNSDAYEELSLAEQGAYLNLCFRSWQEQPGCLLPNDDSLLWRKANARSKAEWLRVKKGVLKRWETTTDGKWIWHKVVRDTFEDTKARYDKAVEAGRAAGRASARARHNLNKDNDRRQRSFNDRSTTVAPTLDDRSTIVNPVIEQEGIEQERTTPPTGGVGGRAVESSNGRARPPATDSPAPDQTPNSLVLAALTEGGGREILEPLRAAIPHGNNALARELVDRCVWLGTHAAMDEGRPVTPADVYEVFIAVSGTPRGVTMDSTWKVSQAWVETTLRACDKFGRDHGWLDLELLDLDTPAETAQPPPKSGR